MIPIYDNLSDDSDQDPDWTPTVSRGRRSLYYIGSSQFYDSETDDSVIQCNKRLSVQDLHKNRHLFLRRRRILLPNSDSGDDGDRSVRDINDNGPVSIHPLPCTVKNNKAARVLGRPYLGFKKLDGKWTACVEKPKRVIKPRCLHTSLIPKSKNSFMCALISDDDRKAIHKQFWRLKTWSEKMAFIKSSAIRRRIRRRRKVQARRTTKKQSGHDIYFNKMNADCTRVKVCQLLFFNTLCIGEDMFRRWTRWIDTVEGDEDGPNEENSATNSNTARRNRDLITAVKT